MTLRRLAPSVLALSPIVALIGCSQSIDDRPREPVAGIVTMDGLRLPDGWILFSPMAEASEKSTSATAEIKDGSFSIPREQGLVPGHYKISVSRAEMKEHTGKAKKKMPERSKVLGPEQIPVKYNKQTTLQREIKRGGDLDVKVELLSK
jgi:hypothetical protein